MKFGVFYELQIPKPWNPGDEHRLFQQALERYTARTKRALEAYKARGDLLRGRVEEFKARGKAGTGA